MFSQTVEYALRAVIAIAQIEGDEDRTSRRLAEITKVPPAYLSKLLRTLVRGEIVDSLRGRRGGFALVKPPSELRILDIVNAIEPLQRIRQCPLQLNSHCERLCPLHQLLDGTLESAEAVLARTTVADVLSTPDGIEPLRESDGHSTPWGISPNDRL